MDRFLGLYIHIPFCASKCAYCDFYSLAGCDNLMPKYQHALLTNLKESQTAFSPYYIDTIYFGGGTPSLYGGRRLGELVDFVRLSGRMLKRCEVTAEGNPDSLTKRELARMREAGINRLSIGVQSDNDDLLKLLGRRHTVRQAEKAIANARAEGFDNISIDLMYGLPGQTKSDWAHTIQWALKQDVEHISCYGLKLEAGTPMEAYATSPLLPTDDDQADMYLYAVDTLEHFGYPQYEVSNFALPGYESRHNIKYWNLEDYMGFGPGAHSCIGRLRYSIVKSLRSYISGVTEEKSIIDEYEEIDFRSRASEYLMLGMRTSKGISELEYRSIYPSDFSGIEKTLEEYEAHGWAVKAMDRWRFTSSGFLLSNALIGGLLDAQTEQQMTVTPWMREAWESSEMKIRIPDVMGAPHM